MPSNRPLDRGFLVAQREFGATVRSTGFIISALVCVAVPVVLLVMLSIEDGRRAKGSAPLPVPPSAMLPRAAPPQEQVAGRLGTARQDKIRDPFGIGAAFFFVFIMFLGTVGIANYMFTSVIEEKNNRTIEVLLSAVSPIELMAGKIAGLAAAGLLEVSITVVLLFAVALSQGLVGAIHPLRLVLFLVYYILGFVFAASVFAAVGAPFNSARDAQSLMMPVILVYILPMNLILQIVKAPSGWLAVLLSYFPPTAATTMVLRITFDPGIGLVEVGLSLLLLGASVVCAVWAATRVFRTGILMYGKPPKIGEILRWVRQG